MMGEPSKRLVIGIVVATFALLILFIVLVAVFHLGVPTHDDHG